nr:hypothetical protein [Tanacetum cinerariifolium]
MLLVLGKNMFLFHGVDTVGDRAIYIPKAGRRVQGVATLGYGGHLTMWRILHRENAGWLLLTLCLQLCILSCMSCVPLIMDTIIRQVQALRIGRWKDAIRFELISDGNQGQGSSAGLCKRVKMERLIILVYAL